MARFVPTRLRDGDELGSFAGHVVEKSRNLSMLYGLTPRQIVEANGVSFTTSAIDEWVLRTGGKRLSNGQPVFSSSSVILLPEGGPRPAVGAPPSTPAPVAVGAGFGLLAALGLAWWAFKD